MGEKYKFIQHKECEFFPCHKGVDVEVFNCLFCYCPLYLLKNECGGNFAIDHGIKNCSGCTKPHGADSYEFIMSKIKLVIERGSDF